MKTSEVASVLHGNSDWKIFCAKYENEKNRLLSRKDGAVTSGDIGLQFDSDQVTIRSKQIERLCYNVLESEIDLNDAQFVASVIALCGFEFDNENTEDAVLFISSLNTSCSKNISEVLQLIKTPR